MKVPVVCLPFAILLAIVSLRASAVPTASGRQSPLARSEEEDLQDLLEYFKLFDKNRDGYLNMEEFSASMEEDVAPSAEDIAITDELFQGMDVNKDAKLSLEEIIKGFTDETTPGEYRRDNSDDTE